MFTVWRTPLTWSQIEQTTVVQAQIKDFQLEDRPLWLAVKGEVKVMIDLPLLEVRGELCERVERALRPE